MRRTVRWYAAFVPLCVALLAVAVAGVMTARGGEKWCADKPFSCSLQTNVVGVVAIGGATTYWYYGFRRARLLARYRREVRARMGSAHPGGPLAADQLDVVRGRVSASFKGSRSSSDFVILTGRRGQTNSTSSKPPWAD